MRSFFIGSLLAWARGLKFPTLFVLIAVLFVITLVIPDAVPLLDELLLALATIALANWKSRNAAKAGDKGQVIEGQARKSEP